MRPKEFKYKQFEGEVILLCVRWYLKYPLSFRNLKDIMMERGIEVSHTSIMRWTHQYASILENKVRRHLKLTNDSWRVDETYIKIKAEWKYLYRPRSVFFPKTPHWEDKPPSLTIFFSSKTYFLNKFNCF